MLGLQVRFGEYGAPGGCALRIRGLTTSNDRFDVMFDALDTSSTSGQVITVLSGAIKRMTGCHVDVIGHHAVEVSGLRELGVSKSDRFADPDFLVSLTAESKVPQRLEIQCFSHNLQPVTMKKFESLNFNVNTAVMSVELPMGAGPIDVLRLLAGSLRVEKVTHSLKGDVLLVESDYEGRGVSSARLDFDADGFGFLFRLIDTVTPVAARPIEDVLEVQREKQEEEVDLRELIPVGV